MAEVAHIWRHPIKSHGREEVEQTTLTAGCTMPGDRVWAVRHDASTADGQEWAPCANFSRGSKAPGLMAINAKLDASGDVVTLSHPNQDDITFRPDDSPAAFFDWVRPMVPDNRAAPEKIIRVPGRGMTDSPFPSISLINLASHRATEQRVGRALSPRRWRANFWMTGLGPWEEFEWIGREMQLGAAKIVIRERIVRCLATTASTQTGQRDADTLGALNSGWGHQDFGIYAEVIEGGLVSRQDRLELL